MSVACDDDVSDDEIFIGKLTMKEIKKHIFLGRPSSSTDFQNEQNSSLNTFNIKEESQNTSIKIIDSHSEPNLNSPWPKHRGSDASFLELESFIDKLSLSPQTIDPKDVLSYYKNYESIKINSEALIKLEAKENHKSSTVGSPKEIQLNVINKQDIKMDNNIINTHMTASITPLKQDKQDNHEFKTPLTSIKSKLINKTSSNTPHTKTLKTPIKKSQFNVPKYKDIMSPVAAYIHQSPQTPLVQNVRHKKTLSGLSLIPQSSNNYKMVNKENIKLPSIAYKNAKVTKLIDLPEDKKIPKSCTKISSSIPKPMIIKHTSREMGPKILRDTNVEDSFANLSYHQAEVSLCTKKTAFKAKPK